jgi:hypothetical protein
MAKMNTEVRNMRGDIGGGPLPDYDHHTRLLAVRVAVLDRA